MIEIKCNDCTTNMKASGTQTEILTDAFCIFVDCCKLINMNDENEDGSCDNMLTAFLEVITKAIFTGDIYKMAQNRENMTGLKHTRIHIEIPNMDGTEEDENADS